MTTTTFEIDYDGNIHYEDVQQKMYNSCWQELVNDSRSTSTTIIYCDCQQQMKRKQKQSQFVCKCNSPKVTTSNKRKK
jgi:hypothetical protein